MKEMMRFAFILGLICFIASGLLAVVNYFTNPRIIAHAQEEEEASLSKVLPAGIDFKPVTSGEEIIYYKAYDKNGKLAGFAFKTSAQGYSSTIETMVGMAKDGKITAIKILSQNETPGLGSCVVEPSFTGKFTNKDIKDLDDVEAITGATISSKAVIDSVKKRAQEIAALIKNEK